MDEYAENARDGEMISGKTTRLNISKGSNVKNKGAGNGRWTGGENTFYENHYQLKLNRKERIKMCDNKCEDCGKGGVILIASKVDGQKDNIEISNLRMLCKTCLGPKKNTKFIKQYGMTLQDLAEEYGVSMSTLYRKYVPIYPDRESMIGALKSLQDKED
jgi:hypothetical protein